MKKFQKDMASSRDFVPATLRAEEEIVSFERTVSPYKLVFMVSVIERQRARSPYSDTSKFLKPSFASL